MKTIKQCLSAFLAAAMVLTAAPAAYAAETPKKGWVLEKNAEGQNKWHYYNSRGEMVKGGFKKIEEMKTRWYYFEEDGDMVSDAWIVWRDKDGKLSYTYALPNGDLAEDCWKVLSLKGPCTHSNQEEMALSEDEKCKWYYFSESTADHPGFLVVGEVFELKDKNDPNKISTFASEGKLEQTGNPSKTDGVMLSRKWARIHTDTDTGKTFVDEVYSSLPSELDHPGKLDQNLRYFMGDGFMAKDKNLFLNGSWYFFDFDGNARKEDLGSVDAATPSAPARKVESVKAVQEEDSVLTAYVGQEYQLKFQVELATASNAKRSEFKKKDHDIWIPAPWKGVNSSVIDMLDEQNGIVGIWLQSDFVGSDEITLYVDGIPSSPYRINVVMPSIDATGAGTTPEKALGDILDNINNSSGTESAGVDSLKAAYSTADDETKTALKSEWINKETALGQASAAYAATYNILEEEPKVTADAQNQLRTGEIKLTGGALNVPSDDNEDSRFVQLTVDSAEVPPLSETFTNTVAFDISLVINGKEQPDPELPVIISMPLPYGISSNVSEENLALYNIHNRAKEEITDFTIADGTVTFVTDKFSTYVFAQKAQTVNPPSPGQSGGSGSGSGSGSSSGSSGGSTVVSAKTGAWKQNETGWWYEYSDGTYPKSGWMQLSYNNRTDWYYFDAEGYMMTGWIQDGGLWYYLNPVSDGTMGAMMTGWIQDGGLWYYLNPVSGGPQGSMSTGWVQDGDQWYYLSDVSDGTRGHMLASATTPDGYQVGADGAWIQ